MRGEFGTDNEQEQTQRKAYCGHTKRALLLNGIEQLRFLMRFAHQFTLCSGLPEKGQEDAAYFVNELKFYGEVTPPSNCETFDLEVERGSLALDTSAVAEIHMFNFIALRC